MLHLLYKVYQQIHISFPQVSSTCQCIIQLSSFSGQCQFVRIDNWSQPFHFKFLVTIIYTCPLYTDEPGQICHCSSSVVIQTIVYFLNIFRCGHYLPPPTCLSVSEKKNCFFKLSIRIQSSLTQSVRNQFELVVVERNSHLGLKKKQSNGAKVTVQKIRSKEEAWKLQRRKEGNRHCNVSLLSE